MEYQLVNNIKIDFFQTIHIIMNKIREHLLLLIFLTIVIKGFSQEVTFFNADGFFSIGTQSNRTASITLFDIDKDGDLDALIANGRHWAEQNYIYYNDGQGNFDKIITFGNQSDQTIQTKTLDINKDGFLDLITAERQSKNRIYLNDGKQNFSKVIEFGTEEGQTRSIDLGDFDNDGFLDIVTANLGSKNSIYFGDKDLTFKRVFDFVAERMTRSIKVYDLNQDGYLDIIEGNSEERNYVYLGQKNGAFIEIGLRKDLKETTYNIEIGDLNNDGLPDIVESNSGAWNLYYRTQIR